MPADLLTQLAEQLAPQVVVSTLAHELLNHVPFNQLGIHCTTAEPDGLQEAADRCDLAPDPSDDLPVVLGHDSAHTTPKSYHTPSCKAARMLASS